MQDIALLETRIKNLEYYTQLSLLETNTANLDIKDSEGTDRFKSGFFVDNFTSANTQIRSGIKNSIDPSNNELRPSSYTTSIDLVLGASSLTGVNGPKDENADPRYVTDLIGNNVRRSTVDPTNGSEGTDGMGLLTLDYEEVNFIDQKTATRVVNAAPYFVAFYKGTVTLNPSSDIWIEQSRVATQTVEGLIGGFSSTDITANVGDLDPQAGWSPTVWGSWNEQWTGSTTTRNSTSEVATETISGGYGRSDGRQTTTTTTTTETVTRTGTNSRAGTSQRLTTTPGNSINLGDKVISSDVSSFMRSRNIEFTGRRLKPESEIFAFFDTTNVTRYCVPKLIRIQMLSGTFAVGETVQSSQNPVPGLTQDLPWISFRLADAHHRTGPFNDPLDVYTINPYTGEEQPDIYSTASDTLNVDLGSLALEATGQYYGYINEGMILEGQNTGARARVTEVRLISDNVGSIRGSFYIPNSSAPTAGAAM